MIRNLIYKIIEKIVCLKKEQKDGMREVTKKNIKKGNYPFGANALEEVVELYPLAENKGKIMVTRKIMKLCYPWDGKNSLTEYHRNVYELNETQKGLFAYPIVLGAPFPREH